MPYNIIIIRAERKNDTSIVSLRSLYRRLTVLIASTNSTNSIHLHVMKHEPTCHNTRFYTLFNI